MPAKREDIDDFDIWWKYKILGWSQQKIAKYYGVCQMTICNWLHPEKHKENSKKWRESDKGVLYLKEYVQSDKYKESRKEYEQTEERREYVRNYLKKYRQTDKGKEAIKRYLQSDKHKVTIKKYRQSEKVKEKSRIYWQTEQGKINNRKKSSKHRGLCSIPLNEHSEGTEGHHIDEEHIIYIPIELHRSIRHNVRTGEGMEEINTIAFHYITEDTFDKLIAGEI